MTAQLLSLFKTHYIDYRGRLHALTVSFLIGEDKKLYFQCLLDEKHIRFIRLAKEGRWHDQTAGPTTLDEELGSLIERKLF